MKYQEIPFTNNEAEHNFEMIVDGKRSFIDYMRKGDKIYLIHTEVPQELEGKGVAPEMVEKALQYIEDQHLKLVPLCAYVQHYLKRNPDWNRIVA
jgi:predicted GNAT family acetyltransferase